MNVMVERSDELEDRIRPILAGEDPRVQGATLACLVACWLAGHPASMREQVIALHLEGVRNLIPVYEALIGSGQIGPRRRRRKDH